MGSAGMKRKGRSSREPRALRDPVVEDAESAVRNAHQWFESNSGWAPPDEDNLAEWVADGVCRCPDECLVAPDGWCEHGLASWALILEAQAHDDAERAFGRGSDQVTLPPK